MKLILKALTLGVLSFIVAGQVVAQAQGFGGFGGPPDPNRHMGSVTAVDTTANTITIHDRRADTDSTIKLSTDTKYTKPSTVPLTSLAVGDIISAGGRDPIDPAATTVAGTRITILPELPKVNPNPNPNYQPRSINGTILTTTPALTIKTADGTTVTVTTTDDTTVTKTVPALVTDVAVGNNVMIVTKADANGTDLDAVTVGIMPARRGGGFGGGGFGGPPAPTPASPAVN